MAFGCNPIPSAGRLSR